MTGFSRTFWDELLFSDCLSCSNDISTNRNITTEGLTDFVVFCILRVKKANAISGARFFPVVRTEGAAKTRTEN